MSKEEWLAISNAAHAFLRDHENWTRGVIRDVTNRNAVLQPEDVDEIWKATTLAFLDVLARTPKLRTSISNIPESHGVLTCALRREARSIARRHIANAIQDRRRSMNPPACALTPTGLPVDRLLREHHNHAIAEIAVDEFDIALLMRSTTGMSIAAIASAHNRSPTYAFRRSALLKKKLQVAMAVEGASR